MGSVGGGSPGIGRSGPPGSGIPGYAMVDDLLETGSFEETRTQTKAVP
jgi:hypothetical protein